MNSSLKNVSSVVIYSPSQVVSKLYEGHSEERNSFNLRVSK